MMIDRRAFVGGATMLGVGSVAGAQTPPPAGRVSLPAGLPQPNETVDLWPDGAPGGSAGTLVETVNERSTDPQLTDRAVFGISRPRLVVFRPVRSNGAAVLITPGGGYRWVVVDKEGYELGRWLAARGYTAFILFYRLPGEGWTSGADTPLADAQRAMRLIRARADAYGIDPERVAAMGFSAGGHLCADLLTRFGEPVYPSLDAADRLSARPILAAPIYPVISMSAPHAHPGSRELLVGKNASAAAERKHSPHLNVPENAPPTFLIHAEDDEVVPVENSLLLRAALRTRGVPVETHLFTSGGHGFGLRRAVGKPAEAWPELFVAWARTHGL
jgi:acetyl esterase/lipase